MSSDDEDGATATAATARQTVRIIMLGDTSVGKTAFCDCFKTKVFSGVAVATIGVQFTRTDIDLADGRLPLTVDLYDTAGSERYGGSLVRSYFRSADAAIIVFDPQDDRSVPRAIAQFRELVDDRPSAVVLFVGNKLDQMQALDAAQRDERLSKLRRLFDSTASARQPCAEHDSAALNMGVRFISLRDTPLSAFELVRDVAQKVAFNAVRVRMRRERSGATVAAVSTAAPTVRLKPRHRRLATASATDAAAAVGGKRPASTTHAKSLCFF